MRPIDADAIAPKLEGKFNQDYVRYAPTIDAVPLDAVAQMLCDLFGDSCPCNYNDINEWLAGSDGCTENCNKNEDPLLCWKLFIKHYGERRRDA